jgi:uncharacterized protein (DUF2267 family)
MASEADQCVQDLAILLGEREQRTRAARLLKVVLHAVRDLLPLNASLHVIAQLPMFLKAVYVEGWSTHERPRMKHMSDLREYMLRSKQLTAEELPDDKAVEHAVVAVFRVLRNYLSEEEVQKITALLPKDLKKLMTAHYPILS